MSPATQLQYPESTVSAEPLQLIRSIEAEGHHPDDMVARRFRRLFNEVARLNELVAQLRNLQFGAFPLSDQ